MKDRPPKPPRAWNSTLPRPAKPMKRGKRVRPRNPARKATEWERAYLSRDFVRFTKGSRCVACGSRDGSDAAHTVNDGLGRKGSWESVIPLCSGPAGCHARQHARGWGDLGLSVEDRRRLAGEHRRAFADWQRLETSF